MFPLIRAKEPQKSARPDVHVGRDGARIVDDQRGGIVDVDTWRGEHSVDNRCAASVKVHIVINGKRAVHHEAAAVDIRRARNVEIGICDQRAATAKIKVAKGLNGASTDGRRTRKYRPIAIHVQEILNLERRPIVQKPPARFPRPRRFESQSCLQQLSFRQCRCCVRERQRSRPHLGQRPAGIAWLRWGQKRKRGRLPIGNHSREQGALLIPAHGQVLRPEEEVPATGY